jgi:hypothetical protein
MASLYHSGGALVIADIAAHKKISALRQRSFTALYVVSAGWTMRPHCL